MAYYNTNMVIQLTRIAMGITQEDLCEGICSVVTLSRIENGKHAVKKEIYRKIMERMGRMPDTRYAVCVTEDGGLLEEQIQMERAFKCYDYGMAEHYLQKMKETAGNNVLTKQYIVRAEAVADFYQKRIEPKELLERVDAAIRMTVPAYEVYLEQPDKIFPFVQEELLALMTLSTAYRGLGDYKK